MSFVKKIKKRSGVYQAEVISLLKVVETDREWALFNCYFGLALRRSEALRIRFCDIGEDDILIHGKKRDGRVPLSPEFRQSLLKLAV